MIYKLQGAIQPYAWGGTDFIATLLRQTKDNQPKAELWFGDHPQAPSLIETESGQQPLNQWLECHPEVLSKISKTRFGLQLPFLLKVLDVRLPLSIQLHPNKAQAEEGYQREQAQQIPLEKRNYPDNNHKPESMIALSDFWLLHGFADPAIIQTRLAERPSLAPIQQLISNHDMHEVFAKILSAPQETLAKWLNPIIEQPAPSQVSSNPDYWLHYTIKAMNISPNKLDPGLLSFYLFNIVHLNKGEGIFQSAQLPHAYLRGQNIEIMATSNNVLRAGLTPKHIDINELLKIIDCQPVFPNIIPAPNSDKHYQYPAPVDDYTLITSQLAKGQTLSLNCQEATIILLMNGVIVISDKDNADSVQLKSGEASLLAYQANAEITAEEDCYIVIASNKL